MQKQFLDNTGLTELLDELGQYLKSKLDTLTFDTAPTANSTNPVTSGGVKAALDVKADKTELPLVVHMDDTILTCDTSIAEIYTAYSVGRVVQMKIAGLSVLLSLVSSSSSSAAFAVTDKGASLIVSGTNENGSDVWTIDSFIAQERLTFDSTPTTGSQNPITSDGIKTALDEKQDTLVSGTNVKTVNGITLLGSGNITIDGGVQYVEYADYEEMQADMSQESGTIGCDTNLYKYYIFNGQNEKWDAVAKVTDLEWIKTADEGTETYGRLLSDISNASDLYVVNRAPASVETSNGTIAVSYTDLSYIYTFEINSTGQISGGSVPIVTSVKNINGNQLSGSGNIVLDGSYLDYTGEERYNLHASETIDQSLDNLDTAIHNLDSIVGEEILTPTIVEHSYIIRDPAASRGNLATHNTWRVEVFKGLSEGENLLVTYSGTDTSSSAQVAGWYSDGDNLINTNYSYISNLNGYARNIVGKTYLITVPNSTVKALALSLYTNVQAEVKRIGRIQAEIHGIENPNEIESITATESSASGGTNTVTITETNGTSTSFNVLNGINGGSLGDVDIVDVTGDRTDAVMSQKGVTEYGRKVTAEDLAGTSDWIRAKLTEEGWEFGKYLYTNTIRDDTAYCITPLIPINDIIGHSLTWEIGVIANQIKLWYIDANGTRTGYVDVGTTSSSTRTITVASSGGSSAANATHLRISLSASNLPQCYIFDNTTGEYLLKVDEILSESCEDCNLPYGVFENTLLTQEEGDSSFKTMSQEAITEAIKHSRSLNPCQCAFIKGNTYFNLSDEQCAALNNTGIISIICTRLSAWNPSYPTEWRYFRLRGASAGNTTDGFYIGCASHGRMYYQTYANNANNQAQADGANIYNGSKICPAVSVVVWDRINGIVKFYDRTTLITTKQSDEYKLSGFVGTNKYIYMFPGDDQSFLYDLQIYNYDIIGIVDTYINQLEGANYIHECYDGNLKKALSDWGDGGHSTYGNSTAIPYTYDGNTVIMTSTSSCVANSTTTQRGYYVGTTDVARLYESDIEVVSGECKINNRTPNIIEKIVDRDTGDVYSAGDTLGVGKYTICGRAMVVACWSLTYMSGDPMVVKHTANRQKYISCVMHLKCDTLYNGELYDDQADVFYNAGVSPSNTTFKYIRQSKSTAPNFAGQMTLSGNNVYVGDKNYTWKQINNS